MMRLKLSACLLVVAAIVGCSKKDDPLKKAGETCSIDADCEAGLVCRNVCVASDNNPDGGMDGANNVNNVNNLNNVQPEDYIVSYILESDNQRSMFAFDTSSGESVKVHDDNVNCNLGCWMSEDLSWFVYAQQNGPAFDIYKVAANGLSAPGTGEIVVSSVRRAEVLENALTYVKEENNEFIAYFISLSGGAETRVGRTGTPAGTEGDWFIDPASGTGVVFNTTLQTLDVKIGNLGDDITDTTFTVDSQNYQQVSGSYFGGNIATAISPDGNYMAIVTQSAPMDYGACSGNDSECDGDGAGRICGRFDRCAAIELVVHFWDLTKLTNLGTECSADDTCGPVHTCDIPAADQVDQAKCIPRRVVLGLPGEQSQGNPQQTGCQITDGNDAYYYSILRPPISFAPSGDLFLVGSRECDSVPDSGILRLNPLSNDIDVVFGRDGIGYDPNNCYDAAEGKVDITNCNPYIEEAIVSPEGNDLIFIGTNPNVTESALSQTNMDVWSVKRNGEDRTWIGQHPERDVVKQIRVHAP